MPEQQPASRANGPHVDFDDKAALKTIDAISDMVCLCENGVITYINPFGARLLGGKGQEDFINRPFQALFTDDYASIVDDILGMLVDEKKPTSMRVKKDSGGQLSIRMEVVDISGENNNRAVVVGQDITQQVMMSEQIHRSEAQFRKLVDSSLNFVCVCDRDGVITYVNESGVKMVRAGSADDLVGKPLYDLLHDDYRDFIMSGIDALLDSHEAMPARFVDMKGGLIDAETMFTKLSGGKHLTFKVEVRDITARNRAVSALRQSIETLEQRVEERTRELQEEIEVRKRTEEKIRHMASHDNLTGLPNRAMMMDRLDVALHRSHREQKKCAVVFIDLDGFKAVNDNMGHDIGDELLRVVSGRLLECTRETDTVARIGGDEFILILPDLHMPENAQTVVERALQALSQPIEIDGHEPKIGASIGIACYPENGSDGEKLLKLADEAMYRVKGSGKNGFAFA